MSYNRYKLFVGHLSPDARSRDLERFFKDHGFSKSITEVVVKTGYGFVIFDDRRDADDAIYELNGKELLGARLQVEYAKPSGRSDDRGSGGGGGGGGRYGGGGGYVGGYRSSRDSDRGKSFGDRGGYSSKYGRPYNTEYRVYIENLSTRCSWQDIKDYFRQAGEVTFAKCHREKMGEGVVEFANYKDMQNAVRKLNETELLGKRLKLSCDDNYYGSRSRSRSRSRSKRRSRSFSRSPIRRVSRSPMRRFSRSRSRSPRRTFSRSPRRSMSRSRSRSPR